jgi:hypothetical protein
MTDNNLQLGVTTETVVEPACTLPTNGDAADATPQEQHTQGEPRAKRTPGGQRGNRNAMRFGFRSPRSPARYIDGSCDQLRRSLEDAVCSVGGSVSIREADIINAAARHEAAAQKVYAALRSPQGQALSIPEQCRLLVDASNLTDRRVKAIGLLSLDHSLMPWQLPATATNGSGRDATPSDQSKPIQHTPSTPGASNRSTTQSNGGAT